MMGWLRRALRLAGDAPRLTEQTGGQDSSVAVGWGTTYLLNPLPVAYSTYRTMRKDPTIVLARAMAVAPIVAGEWMVEADDEVDEDRVKFVQDQFLGIREPFIETAMLAGIDFGWQAFEKVYAEQDGQIVLKKLKPLYPDITTILVDQATGAFAGFRQRSEDLPLANSLLISFRVEGTQWHGQSLLENVRATYNEWTAANEGAGRYDTKLAGCQPVIKYPPADEYVDNTKTPNQTIAKEVLQGLEAGSGITLPRSRTKYAGGPNEPKEDAWDISLLADSTTRQPGFRDRLDYLDKLKARGLQWPERAILEGMFGTKAEAGAHQDLALTNADLLHRHVTRLLNWHCVDQLLALNYGEEARGTVRLAAAPLVNVKMEFLREVLRAMLAKDAVLAELVTMLDVDGILDMLGLPKSEEVVQDDEAPEPAQPGMDIEDPLGATVGQAYGDNGR
jgi:hypothetical protein